MQVQGTKGCFGISVAGHALLPPQAGVSAAARSLLLPAWGFSPASKACRCPILWLMEVTPAVVTKTREDLFLDVFLFFFTAVHLHWTWSIQVIPGEVRRLASHMGSSSPWSPLRCRKTVPPQLLFAWKTQSLQPFWALPAYFSISCWLPWKWLQWGNLWAGELWVASQAFGGLQCRWLQSCMHSSTADIRFALCKVLIAKVLHDLCQRKETGISDARWPILAVYFSLSHHYLLGIRSALRVHLLGLEHFLKCSSFVCLPSQCWK